MCISARIHRNSIALTECQQYSTGREGAQAPAIVDQAIKRRATYATILVEENAEPRIETATATRRKVAKGAKNGRTRRWQL